MPRLAADGLRELGEALLTAVGAAPAQAELVADHLVESGLLGHDSHSVLRLPQYVEMVRSGKVRVDGQLEILRETPWMAQVSGHWGFGAVTATEAMKLAVTKAQAGGFSTVTVRDCNHVARLGRFAAMAAAEGNLIGAMCANGHGGDLAVAPHGGRERRLPTNPLAVAIPTLHEWPIVLDMTTSMTSGGALRHFQNLGAPVPEGCIIDGEGNPSTDVEAYYGPPPGAILPLGYPQAGHRGFGLAVVVDILAGALSGAGCTQADPPEAGNALFIWVLNVEAFGPKEEFLAETGRFIEWVKSSLPAAGFEEVVLPGENSHRILAQRECQGMWVDETAWAQIGRLAEELGVVAPKGK